MEIKTDDSIWDSKDLPKIIKKANLLIHWASRINIDGVDYYLCWKGGGHNDEVMARRTLAEYKMQDGEITEWDGGMIKPRHFRILYNDLAPSFGNNLYAIYASGEVKFNKDKIGGKVRTSDSIFKVIGKSLRRNKGEE